MWRVARDLVEVLEAESPKATAGAVDRLCGGGSCMDRRYPLGNLDSSTAARCCHASSSMAPVFRFLSWLLPAYRDEPTEKHRSMETVEIFRRNKLRPLSLSPFGF